MAWVIVVVRLEDDDLGTDADDEYVDRLEVAIRDRLEAEPHLGYWDGHEFGGGWAAIFCYGNDAPAISDAVTKAILPFRLSRQLCITNQCPGEEDGSILILNRRPEEEPPCN